MDKLHRKEDWLQRNGLLQVLKWVDWAFLILMKLSKAFVKILFRELLSNLETTLPPACLEF
jgi:hypothetical protein